MNILSQKEEKNSSKYKSFSRALQAQVLDDAGTRSQHELAAQYGIARTTLQHWADRKEKLKEGTDPNIVDFFESSSGQAWLHRMVLAAFVVFHKNGNSGTPDLHEFFEMADIGAFVGISVSALQKISKQLDQNIVSFGDEEVKRLAENMPHKDITGALDENFIMDEMTLILMDPVSDYILAEQIEEKRDCATWLKVTQGGLKGLNVTIQQLVGDEAGGLTKLATSALNVLRGEANS